MKVVWDLDGTLANNEHRLHLLPKKGEGDHTSHWTAFNQACVDDEVIFSTYAVYQQLSNLIDTIIVTGRGEDSINQTREWLGKHHMLIGCDELHMRPVDDHRRSKDFKYDKFMEIGLCAGDLLFEDDHQVIKMVREHFPGVIICEVPSGCCAVQQGRSNNELQDEDSKDVTHVEMRCNKQE